MSRVHVVIVNWNGWRDTLECLDSLLRSGGVDFSVIVCDNASRDGSADRLQEWAEAHLAGDFERLPRGAAETGCAKRATRRLVLIDNGANLGFAGANNVGMRCAMSDPACEYVWLLNNDTAVEPDALARAVSRMDDEPSLGLCGSTLVYFHERESVQAFGGARYSQLTGKSSHIGAFAHIAGIPVDGTAVERELSYVIGAAMLVRRDFIERVGYMQEDYFLYFEELDWAARGARDFRLGYAPRSVVFHKEGATIGTSASGGSRLSVYYLFRNRLRFTCRFHPLSLPTVLFASFVDIARFLYRRRWPQFVAGLRGLCQLPPEAEVGGEK